LVTGTELESRHHFHWALVAHVEAEVAAKHDPVGSNEIDEIAQRLRRVTDRVGGEAPEITSRRLFQRTTFLSHLPTMVETANEIGKSTSGMRQANVELGKAIEESAKD
jgi:hypothetical protein